MARFASLGSVPALFAAIFGSPGQPPPWSMTATGWHRIGVWVSKLALCELDYVATALGRFVLGLWVCLSFIVCVPVPVGAWRACVSTCISNTVI